MAKASGEIIEGSTSKLLEPDTGVFDVKIPQYRSFYSYYGDVFLYSLALLMLFELSYSLAMTFNRHDK